MTARAAVAVRSATEPLGQTMLRRISTIAVSLVAGWLAPAHAGDLPPGFVEATILDGLESPASFDFTPNGRIMFSERVAGHLRIATESPVGSGQWTIDPAPYATFDTPKQNGAPLAHRSSGVRGFEFDPDYLTNGYVYVFYMKDNPRQNRVVRIREDPSDPSRALPGETVLLELPFNSSSASGSHNGGALRFGPDGMLYVTTGDGWSGGNPVQTLTTWTGKVLRIAPDGSIPVTNPFYAQASGDFRAIYALGLRNPYTLSRNDHNGWLVIGEANGAEKANLLRVEAAANYRHQGFAGIGNSTSRWANGAGAGSTSLVTGGAWYPNSGPFPSQYHGAYFVALWGTNGANGGPPGALSYVRSATDTTVHSFGTNIGQFDGAGTRLKPVHLRVGPDGSLYYLLTSYITGAGRIVRVSYTGQNQITPPVFAPDGGAFAGPVSVLARSRTPGVTIRYTLDGTDPGPSSPVVSGPLQITSTSTLKARAWSGASASSIASADFIIGAAANAPPVAHAGPDQVVALGDVVALNGAASYDPDGSALNLSENWSQVSGPRCRLANTDETVALALPQVTGRYVFRIDVTDGIDTASDTTSVSVVECVHDVTDGLIGRWSFESGSGEIALDSASGLWNGALEGPAWSSLGIPNTGGSLEFDGSSDVVQVGCPDVAGDEISITAWIRPDDFGVGDARIISKARGTAEADHVWMLSTVRHGGAHRLRFRVDVGGTVRTLIASGGDLRAGDWACVAAVYDGQSMALYKDGSLVGSMAATGAIATSPSTPAAIGNQPQGGRSFDGLIDEVRVYARALDRIELGITARRHRNPECDD